MVINKEKMISSLEKWLVKFSELKDKSSGTHTCSAGYNVTTRKECETCNSLINFGNLVLSHAAEIANVIRAADYVIQKSGYEDYSYQNAIAALVKKEKIEN